MTKVELRNKLVEKVDGMKKADAVVVIDALSEVIAEALVAGDEIVLHGVGKLTTKEVPEKTGVIRFGENAGTEYVTPAHRKPVFRAATALKEALK